MERDAVDDRGDESGIGDDLAPFAELEVRRDRDAGFLVAFGEDLEQEFRAAAVEGDVAEFVDAEQVESAGAGDESGELSLVGSFDEFVDELRAGGVTHAASLFARGDPESDEEMSFSGSGVAEEHDGLTVVEVGASGKGRDRRRVDARRGIEVELGESFHARESGFVDASHSASFSAVIDLKREGLSARNPR